MGSFAERRAWLKRKLEQERRNPTHPIQGIAMLAALSRHPWEDVYLGMLSAAFDASGTEHDQRIFVVAGFVSSAKDWVDFDKLWRARLQHDGLTYFHMHSFAHSINEFSGWRNDEGRRRALLSDLLGIISAHTYRKFGSIVINRFVNAKLSERNRNAFLLTSYSLAGLTVVHKIRKWMRRDHMSTTLKVTFEDGDLHKGKLVDAFAQHGLPIPNFEPKKDTTLPCGIIQKAFVPLQAADILAYELLNAYTKVDIGKAPLKIRWPYQQLRKIPGEPGIYMPNNMETLEQGLSDISESDLKALEWGAKRTA